QEADEQLRPARDRRRFQVAGWHRQASDRGCTTRANRPRSPGPLRRTAALRGTPGRGPDAERRTARMFEASGAASAQAEVAQRELALQQAVTIPAPEQPGHAALAA